MARVWHGELGDAGSVSSPVRLGFNVSVSKGALHSSEVSKASESDPGND